MKKIGVFTSGGDSPGMNACVRAVVRTAIYHGVQVYGIYRGYEGMIDDEIKELSSTDVSNIIQRGGTILKSARSERFMDKKWREVAFNNLNKHGIEGVVAVGGDGTFTGAKVFHQEFGVKFAGAPGTIDNDLYGTDCTIGYDTALNTVVEAVDKLRDTADSHDRLFFIEVMGRDAGFIALRSGIGVGAEAILIPETKTYVDDLMSKLQSGWRKNKKSNIVIIAEGDDSGGAVKLAEKVKQKFPHFDLKVSILGHIQRGGSPSAYDRVLASHLGHGAVEALLNGQYNVMAGMVHRQVLLTPFEKAIKHNKGINESLLHLAEVLSV
jgi:6-phosphofructokinase 1